MNSKLIGLTFLVLSAGALLGWTLSDTEVSEVSDNDVWQSFETSLAGQKKVSETAKKIKASGIIREFLSAAEKQAAEADVEEDGMPPLPQIIATSIVNGEAQVHIKTAEGRPLSLIEGDTLENGWALKAVSLSGVTLQYEDTERVLPLKEYDLTPEDVAENNDADEKENEQ